MELQPNFMNPIPVREVPSAPSFFCSALTLEQLEEIPSTVENDSECQVSLFQLKDKLIQWHISLDTLNSTLFLMKNLTDKDYFKEHIEKLETNKQKITNFIKENESKLEEMLELKKLHSEYLIVPKLGDNDVIDVVTAKIAIPCFGIDNTSLKQFWNKFTDFSNMNDLSEKAQKKLLSAHLHNEPHDVYSENSEKSLETILKILVTRFGNIETISDHLKSLENIKRGPQESLASVMQRVSVLLDKTYCYELIN